MIYITGDTHGDFSRFATGRFPPQRSMTKNDFVIICGDFGIWDRSAENRYWIDWLEDKPFTTLFVAGNHSNYDLLKEFPVENWNGGKIQRVRPSVIHLMRGQVFIINGKRFFTMGGASSHDIEGGILDPDAPDFDCRRRLLIRQGACFRVNHISWWKEEMPVEKEYQEACNNLNACGWKADYIISHCCPSSVQDIIGSGFYQPDALTDFFEGLRERLSFRYWFFGHYHDERILFQKYILLYRRIINLEEFKDTV